MQVVIMTGMSGAGKSTALKMMEDMGYFCMDNLPIDLMERFVDLAFQDGSRFQKVAVSIDIRSGENLESLHDVILEMKKKGLNVQLLYLDASDEVLVKRYKETRRSHPLAGGQRVEKGIELERKAMEFLRGQADFILDTSQLLTRELKLELEKIFLNGREFDNLYVTILSFGFKYGIPTDSDLVFDVRFLPNPYYVEGLRAKNGNDKEIQDFVMGQQNAGKFLDKLEDMLRFLLPNYVEEGKNQLVIAVGCTGGKHRSVTLANELYKRLKNNCTYGLKIEHRDLEKDALRGK
ncbi:glmZ(sRNA)-inactivating NTPase [uncultured Roseburia sp.]|uniref:RNase adapter RapZ n=1 Tax=Brotonthovivens ammoniilytica TaxID=2981725 RepID=A0ABT2TM33_9FIRM|nr:RNase adapter RapZ [Brotonthovivens ammoniilytica]MCU6763258.1 RNase adapter RapZ [Brotonthovivens ammoniilytica]SCJ11106.1 glmZ(sRNA)-inactivating NTPase [uncultured Roseburia sp.]